MARKSERTRSLEEKNLGFRGQGVGKTICILKSSYDWSSVGERNSE